MKKTLSIAIGVAILIGAGGAITTAAAPYSPKVMPASADMKPITAYSLSTTLKGTDCYLDRLEELKNDGITHMEVAVSENYDEQSMLFSDGITKIQNAGLKVSSIHLPFGFSVSPAAMSENERQVNVENIKRFIDLTQSAGAKIYVIHASYEPIADADRKVMIESAIKSLTELNSYASEKGIVLTLENLPRSCIGNSIEEIEQITNAVPDLKLCLDTNHFTNPKPNYVLRPLQRLFPSMRDKMNPIVGTPTEFATKFADKIATVHISDYDKVDECHWFPGQGIVDFQSIHTVIINAGFNAPITFEPNEKCKGIKTTGKRLITSYEKSIGLASK